MLRGRQVSAMSRATKNGRGPEPRDPASGSDATREHLVDEIERLVQQLTRQGQARLAARVGAYGLTLLQYVALLTIARLGPDVTMGEIGEAIHAPASSMTGIVDRLEREGFVERGRHPADRRAVVARITPPGATIVREIEAQRRGELDAVLNGLSDADLRQFIALLSRMLDRTAAGTEGAPPATA